MNVRHEKAKFSPFYDFCTSGVCTPAHSTQTCDTLTDGCKSFCKINAKLSTNDKCQPHRIYYTINKCGIPVSLLEHLASF